MASRKQVSLNEIAAFAQVSISTVSLVLNNRGNEMRISEATQKKIKKAARELGYIFNDDSSDDILNRTKMIKIAIFFPNSFQDFPMALFDKGISRYAAEAIYHIDWVYHPFVPNQLKNLQFLFSNEYYNGIIIAAPYENDIHFLKQNHFSVPVILYNCQINDYTCICHDDYEIGRQAAEVFFKHHRQKIAVVKPKICNKGINVRLAGFTNYLSDMHFPEKQIFVSTGFQKDTAGGYMAISQAFAHNFIPSAIYVINDLMTGGVLNFLYKKQLRIPDDVEILSYGDIDAASLVPSVSSYIPKSDEMAHLCIKSLMAELNGSVQPGLFYGFGTECIWRESCPPL